jgi:hypothetical protein
MDIKDFDAWREAYAGMTYQEQQAFYDRVEADHPLQKGFTLLRFHNFFLHIASRREKAQGKTYVLELGGWKGELAQEMLKSFPFVAIWCNVEICRRAVEKSVFASPCYTTYVPPEFPWRVELPPSNVLVASHFIEHISQRHLERLVRNLPDTMRYLAIEAPIPADDSRVDWTGYHGSHILEIGWKQVIDLLRQHGFELIAGLSVGNFKAFAR